MQVYSYPVMQCVFLILYIHSIYGILYMYTTKYGCVFLKLGESIYVAMDLIPVLLGSLPLAHNAQHLLVMIELSILFSVKILGIRTYIRTAYCGKFRACARRLPYFQLSVIILIIIILVIIK